MQRSKGRVQQIRLSNPFYQSAPTTKNVRQSQRNTQMCALFLPGLGSNLPTMTWTGNYLQ